MSVDALIPDETARAEPFWAIMETDADQHPTANIFAHGKRILLFEDRRVAERLLDALSRSDVAHSYAIRGVSAEHLRTLSNLADGTPLELWEIVSVGEAGEVSGHPIRALGEPFASGEYFAIEE